MKFALNGALTIGTLDGANVEIRDHVGAENIFIFGLEAEEAAALRPAYDPAATIAADPALAEVVDQIAGGFFSPGDPGRFAPLVENLTGRDYFLVAADFRAYYDAQRRVDAAYRDTDDWMRRAALNTARMGWFSSDRTIRGYARDVWGVEPLY
jgi:starch phosphorylase